MAYQTLPNTFVSATTIYSSAVSANMVALLNGYTTGGYDGWFNDLKVSGVVTGNVTVTGDIRTTAWATLSTASASMTGWGVVNGYGYRWKTVGKTCFVNVYVMGNSTATTSSINLPVTAGANSPSKSKYHAVVCDDAATYTAGGVAVSAGTNRLDCYPNPGCNAAWSSPGAGTRQVWTSFFYEID